MSIRVAMRVREDLVRISKNSLVLLRSPLDPRVKPGQFERVIAAMCIELGLSFEWCRPEPGTGRGGTYDRDYDMVSRADYVEVFFHADRIMEGGTGHLVEAALSLMIPVYAWTVDEHGQIWRVGEMELEDYVAQPTS
jgi:hypothetical protein